MHGCKIVEKTLNWLSSLLARTLIRILCHQSSEPVHPVDYLAWETFQVLHLLKSVSHCVVVWCH